MCDKQGNSYYVPFNIKEVSDQWAVGLMGCRTNGLSDQWAVKPMGCRTTGKLPTVPTSHNVRAQGECPTTMLSLWYAVRSHKVIYIPLEFRTSLFWHASPIP